MFIEITTAIGCKNNCVFCPQKKLLNTTGKYNRNTRLMRFSVFKKIIDKLPREMAVDFAGMCEPFQNPECTRMILYANNKGHKIYIYTTLAGLNKKDLYAILKSVPFNDSECRFSVHLPSVGQMEHIHVNNEYMEILETLLNSKINMNLHYHGTKPSRLVDLAIKKSTYKAVHAPLLPRGKSIDSAGIRLIKRKRGRLMCSLYDAHGHVVMPDGSVGLCCIDWGLDHKLGNLLVSDYQSIITGSENRLVAKGLSDEDIDVLCRYCYMSEDKNARAEYYNSAKNLRKLYLGTGLFLSGRFPAGFKAIRSLKNALTPKSGGNEDFWK